MPRLHVRSVASALLVLCAATAAQVPAVRHATRGELESFDVSRASVQEWTLPRGPVRAFSFRARLGAEIRLVTLTEHDVRTKDFRLYAADADGVRLLPTPPNTTFRGFVHGDPDSAVAASLVDGQLSAMIRLDGGTTTWGIQPLRELDAAAPRTSHIVYDAADSAAPRGRCGVQVPLARNEVPRAPTAMGGNQVYTCEIAVDADNRLYKANGSSVATTQNTVTGIVNATTVIYTRDTSIDYKITTILVRTSTVYTSMSTLLTDFRTRWNANHTSIQRDTAHVMSGGSGEGGGVIGRAYLSTICSKTSSYGASWVGYTSNLTNRVGLVSHELGHSWSSGHCSGSSCYIMCPTLGGCGRNLTKFGAASISSITTFRASRSCLSTGSPPTITGIAPKTVTAFDGGTVTLTGSNFTGATRVLVDSTALNPGTDFKVVSDSSNTFDSATASSFQPASVRVEANGQTSSPVALNYTVTQPPKLKMTGAVRNGFLIWTFGGIPGELWFLTVSSTSSSISALGFTFLSPFVVFGSGGLDGVGTGATFTFVPGNLPVGLKFYSQVVTMDGKLGKFTGTSPIVERAIQ